MSPVSSSGPGPATYPTGGPSRPASFPGGPARPGTYDSARPTPHQPGQGQPPSGPASYPADGVPRPGQPPSSSLQAGRRVPSISAPGVDYNEYNGGSHAGPLDPIAILIMSVPGTPGQDYPIYAVVPVTSFQCSQYSWAGLYGDVEAGCQVSTWIVFPVIKVNNTSNMTDIPFL